MRQYKPTPFSYTRITNTDNHEKNSNYEDSHLLDLEVKVLKQRIDSNIKHHMDLRSEIRMEVDKLRQENMDLAAMLHRTDETFYLHQDFFDEVNRLRSMNVRLKAMMCLQDVKSIEVFGPSKSRRRYQRDVQQRTSPNSPATSQSTDHERDTCAETSDKSNDLFNRIDKLEAEMRTFLGENPSHNYKKEEICQRQHVSDVDRQCSVDRLTKTIREFSVDDNLFFVGKRDTNSFAREQKYDRTNACNASTSTVQPEAKDYGHVDGLHSHSTFWIKDQDLHFDKTYTNMNYLRPKADRDVSMNSSRSKDTSVISEERDINMNSHRSNDECVLPDPIIINSSRKSECMLLMVHPKRSHSGTIVGFEVAENFEGTSSDKDKPVHHEVIRTPCELTQPVFQKGVSDLVPGYGDITVSIEDLEIRDIFKNISNESDSKHSTTSSERMLKLSTPFTVVSTKHVRPRDVPRLNLGDLVSESDINIIRVTQDTVDDLLYDDDRYSSVSYIDISNGSGHQHLEIEDMCVTDLQHNQFGRYCNDRCHFINNVSNFPGKSCFMENNDQHSRSDNPKNFSNRRSNLKNMIKKLCANKEMSYMQEFFCNESANNRTAHSEVDAWTNESIREDSERTNISENTTWNNKLNEHSKLSTPAFQTKLEEETPWVNLNDVNGVHISEDSVPVIPSDSEENGYAHYMELCNTTMHLTGIIQDMCANRIILPKQELLQHTNPSAEPCPPEIWDGRHYVIENNIMRIPAKFEFANQHARPDSLPKHCVAGLSSPHDTDIIKLTNENVPWTFPQAEEKNNNGTKESEDKECVKDKSMLNVTIPCCTMDSARSDVSCIDLQEETPDLGSTRREPAVNACFIRCESPTVGMAEYVTNRTGVLGDTMYTDRFVVPGELALSCQNRKVLSTTLSESHEDVVRLLNWTNVSHTKAAWEDPEHEAILQETSVQEILTSPDSFVGDFTHKQKWKPCFMSETIPKEDEEMNPTFISEYINMDSGRSGYDVEAEISCIDLSEETTTTSSVQNCHSVKEFLQYDGDKLDTQEVFYTDLSPCWSTSATSYDETTYCANIEETDSLYVTASENDSELSSLASPDSLAGYARRDQMWEEDFVFNYMTRATKERIDKEYTKLLITHANKDIDKIHEIRIPVLLAEENRLESNDLLTDEQKARLITEAMDSPRSDLSCIELSQEEPTLCDIGEEHVVKGFLLCDEVNQRIPNVVSDKEESVQWAVPTKHVIFELAVPGSSSADDQVILTDIENDNDGSDITGNDVTSVQDGDSCMFDMDEQDVCLTKQDENGQSDPGPPDELLASNTTPVLLIDNTNLHLDFISRMSELKKQGPRASFKFLQGLNLKLEKVKQDLMKSSRLSKWLIP